MTAGNILIYIAIIGFMIYRRVQGRPVESVKALLVLPGIICILGWQDMVHAHHLNNVDIAISVIGCIISLALGGLRGAADKVSERNGIPWVQWSVTSIVILVVNVVIKLGLDLGGVAVGGTSSGVTSSLLLAVGLMILGESLIILYRVKDHIPPATPGSGNGSRGRSGLLGGGGLLGGSGLLGGGSAPSSPTPPPQQPYPQAQPQPQYSEPDYYDRRAARRADRQRRRR